MRRVLIESPFAGASFEERTGHLVYARAALRDALRRGEAPFASHLLYTQDGVLNDREPAERTLGMRAGFAWGAVADLVAVYTDRGISTGMKAGITRAEKAGIPVEHRSIGALAVLSPVAGALEANDSDADLSPTLLASMLATVGIPIEAAVLAFLVQDEDEIRALARYVRAVHARTTDPTQPEPVPPPGLASYLAKGSP